MSTSALPQYDYDSGDDRPWFAFMSAVSHRRDRDPIALDLGAGTLFRGEDVGVRGGVSKAWRGSEMPPLQVRKNLWQLPATFFVNGRLVVRADIAGQLAAVSTATFIQVRFAETYSFPFDVVRGSFLPSHPDPFGDCGVDEELEILETLVARHAVPPPADEFFEVACEDAESIPACDVLHTTVHQHFEAVVIPVPTSIEAHGIVWHGGYLCSRQVADILLPTLVRRYVWVTREALASSS